VVCAVLGLVEHDGGPVVGLVLLERARRARRLGRQIVGLGVHGDVERVSTDDLVQVWRVGLAGVDQRVDTVDDELGAREAQHVELGRGILRQQRGGSEGCQLHRGKLRRALFFRGEQIDLIDSLGMGLNGRWLAFLVGEGKRKGRQKVAQRKNFK